MSYSYEIERARIFSDEGQRHFLTVRDVVEKLIVFSGAARAINILEQAPTSGDTFLTFACLDRMIELGEIREVSIAPMRGQDRVFVFANKV